jgi:chitinase
MRIPSNNAYYFFFLENGTEVVALLTKIFNNTWFRSQEVTMMKGFVLRIILVCTGMLFPEMMLRAQSPQWVTAYYAGWSQGGVNNGVLPAEQIDYSAIGHIIHFALVPNPNGTLDDQKNSVTAANANVLISCAHAAGKKVLIAVGGWGSESAFRSATNGTTRATFVNNLVNLMRTRRYDGIDVDWEPLNSGDAANYSAFVTDLRTALNAVTPRPLLTMATQWTAPISASVASQVDQINIMTYDLAGAWSGWVVWHNAATYDGGVTIGSQTISADGFVNKWNAAGVPLSKLGIGIDFYGYVWSGGDGTPSSGATAPGQSWTTAPSVQANVPYYTIMSDYYQPGYYRWDANAQASYLSIDNAGSSSDKFISYDDEATITAKINYARNKHIGGVIIWELGGGYRSSMPVGQRDLLLQAVKKATQNIADN